MELMLLLMPFMKTILTRSVALLVGALLPLLSSCSSAQIQTATDPQADLSKYKTYAWAPQTSSPDRPQSSILDQTVKSSTEKELAAKGLHLAKDSQPDLLISYFGVSRSEVTFGAPISYYPHPGHAGQGGYYDPAYVTQHGSLTLQFIDPKTNRTVWQGTASDTISEAGASQEQVAKAVNELIDRYPAA